MQACILVGAEPEVRGVRGEQGLPSPHRQGTPHDLTLVWEAAKKVPTPVVRPIRGGGDH